MGLFFNRKKKKLIAEVEITTEYGTVEVSRDHMDKINRGYVEIGGELYSPDMVFVSSRGGEVYHRDHHCCGMSISTEPIPMTEQQAIKQGLRPCKRCENYDYRKYL